MGIYLFIVNILGLIVMLYDKAQARSGAWRISEKNLLLIALVGGTAGVLIGMHLFRHKTRHIKFTLGVPAILIIQFILLRFLRGSV